MIVRERTRASAGPSAPPHHEELVAGAATFVDDVHLPGALAAVIVRSPEPHGRLRAIDADAARTMPGVRAVLTAADLPTTVPVIPIRSFEQPGMASAVQPVLAHDRVRYVGEPLAIVVAEDPYLAEDAAEHVLVDVDPLPPVLDAAAADELLFDRPEGNLLCRWDAAHGDIDEALARAAVVVDEELCTARHTGGPLETRGIVAEWSADGRTLRLWGPTKFLSFTRRVVAGWFGLDEDAVECAHVSVGGMFGVRGEIYPEDFLIPWAARVAGRPVRWCEDRREHLVAINHAPGLRYRVQIGVAEDGRVLGLRAEIALDMGAYARGNGGRLALLALEELPGPYAWDALRISVEGWATSKVPVGSVRAPVALESTFARERALDIAAQRLGLDPAGVRRRSLVPADAMPYTRRFGGDLHDHVLADGDYPGFFDRLLDTAGYASLRTTAARRRAAGELVGVGIGLFAAHSGLGREERVEIGVRDGRITVSTAASEVGQGLDRVVRLVASEALVLPGEEIAVESGATAAPVATQGTYSSRLTIFVGNAVLDGCRQLVEAAREIVAVRAGATVDDVELVGGGLEVAGDRIVPWSELEGLAVVGAHRDEHPTYGFGGHVAFVSVDAATAAVSVERLALAYDCGRVLDLRSVCDQLRGGAIHGLGTALLEELFYDENAQPVGGSFVDYLLPSYAEVPADVRIEVLPGLAVTNALGVKGTGEAGVIGVGAAVANAVADALGSCGAGVRRLPLSPRALEALVAVPRQPGATTNISSST